MLKPERKPIQPASLAAILGLAAAAVLAGLCFVLSLELPVTSSADTSLPSSVTIVWQGPQNNHLTDLDQARKAVQANAPKYRCDDLSVKPPLRATQKTLITTPANNFADPAGDGQLLVIVPNSGVQIHYDPHTCQFSYQVTDHVVQPDASTTVVPIDSQVVFTNQATGQVLHWHPLMTCSGTKPPLLTSGYGDFPRVYGYCQTSAVRD